MTYLHKLAKRLAFCFPIASALACSKPEEKGFLSPTPGNQNNQIVSIEVKPKLGTVRPGEALRFSATARTVSGSSVAADIDWSATGGTIGSDGTFIADALGRFGVRAKVRALPQVTDSASVAVYTSLDDIIGIELAPDSTTLYLGEGLQLDATAELASGAKSDDPALAWSATGGSVDGSGWYTPAAPGTYVVIAAAKYNVEGNSRVNVKPRGSVMEGLRVSPETAVLEPGEGREFSAVALLSDGTTSPVNVSWSSDGGTITGQGSFTAGSTPGSFRVFARYKKGSFLDTAFVTIKEPSITAVTISPVTTSLSPGGSQQYVATAELSDGSTKTVGATWNASGGSISSGGLYTAPGQTGSYQVIGQVTGTGFADTSSVAVSSGAATLTQLVLNPSTANVPSGGLQQFSVTGLYSDGTTSVPAVTYSATGGTISSGGLYLAGNQQGEFRVIAVEPVSGKADTSVVNVGAPQVESITVSPDAFTLQPTQSQQLTATVSLSDGSVQSAVAWSASGGSITQSGLFTAGGVAGTYQIVASTGAAADTSLVTVQDAEPTLQGVQLTPENPSVQAGGSKQFVATGSWSDGSSGQLGVNWAATGGSITAGGLYTAGSLAGTFRVIASHQASGLADTTQVTVTAPPTLVALEVSPESISLDAGQTQQYAAVGVYSNGGTGTPSVTWSATGGTISSSGLYTAGTVTGAFLVIATCGCGDVADTVGVQVTGTSQPPPPPPAVLQSVEISPAAVALAPGGSQQFLAIGRMSDGAEGSLSINWSATGGSVTQTGAYAAGQSTGAYQVIALHSQSGLADTATVLIQEPGQTTACSAYSSMELVAEHSFDHVPGNGTNGTSYVVPGGSWGSNPTPNFTTQADASATFSADKTLQVRWQEGMHDGTGPGLFWAVFGRTYKELCVTYRVRIPTTVFENQFTGTKLLGYLAYGKTNRSNQFFLLMKGGQNAVTSGPWNFEAAFTAEYGGGPYLSGNLGTGSLFTPLVWHTIEIYFKLNDDGVKNGVFKMWDNGVQTHSYNNLTMVGSAYGTTAGFRELHFAPIWGGSNNTVKSRDDFMNVDHVRVIGIRQ